MTDSILRVNMKEPLCVKIKKNIITQDDVFQQKTKLIKENVPANTTLIKGNAPIKPTLIKEMRRFTRFCQRI